MTVAPNNFYVYQWSQKRVLHATQYMAEPFAPEDFISVLPDLNLVAQNVLHFVRLRALEAPDVDQIFREEYGNYFVDLVEKTADVVRAQRETVE